MVLERPGVGLDSRTVRNMYYGGKEPMVNQRSMGAPTAHEGTSLWDYQ